MSNKQYNGLKPQSVPMPFGGQIQSLARQPSKQEMQAMLSQQLQVLAREIYVRAAADAWRDEAGPFPELFRKLANMSQMAAKAYFEAMGVQFEDKPADSPEEPQPAE